MFEVLISVGETSIRAMIFQVPLNMTKKEKR